MNRVIAATITPLEYLELENKALSLKRQQAGICLNISTVCPDM